MTDRSETHRVLDTHCQRWLDACRFVLVRPSLAANIGSAVRALATMGVHDLAVVAPDDADFRHDEAALARAGGARARLHEVASQPTLDAAIADCQLAVAVSAEGRAFGPPPEYPAPLCDDLVARLAEGGLQRVAFVFGTERTGLSVEQMARCQRWLTIPADAAYSSLNLAQAVQIVAFSLRQAVLARAEGAGQRQDGSAGERMTQAAAQPACLEALEGLYRHAEQSLTALGTLQPARPRRLMARLRSIIGRARLDQDEVDLLRGICRDIERLAAQGAQDRGAQEKGGQDKRAREHVVQEREPQEEVPGAGVAPDGECRDGGRVD